VSFIDIYGVKHTWTAALDHFLADLAGCAVPAVRGGLATLSLSLGFLGFFLLIGSAM